MNSKKWSTGDFIQRNGDKRKILFAGGEIVFISSASDFKKPDIWFTQYELEQDGWRLVEEDWEPEANRKYYFLGSGGNVVEESWMENKADLFRLSIGNCFKSEAEALAYRERLIAKGKI